MKILDAHHQVIESYIDKLNRISQTRHQYPEILDEEFFSFFQKQVCVKAAVSYESKEAPMKFGDFLKIYYEWNLQLFKELTWELEFTSPEILEKLKTAVKRQNFNRELNPETALIDEYRLMLMKDIAEAEIGTTMTTGRIIRGSDYLNGNAVEFGDSTIVDSFNQNEWGLDSVPPCHMEKKFVDDGVNYWLRLWQINYAKDGRGFIEICFAWE